MSNTNRAGAAKKQTATEALKAAGFVHANRGPNAAHDIYDAKSGELVARLHANEAWSWLKRGEQPRFAAYRMTLGGELPTNVGFMAWASERLAAFGGRLLTDADHAAFTAFLWGAR